MHANETVAPRIRSHFKRLIAGPQFTAVVDCVFDLVPRRTEPAFAELRVVDDCLVFARARGEKHFRHFVGRHDRLALDLLGFVTHLGLGADERAYVQSRIDAIPSRDDR